MRILGINDKRDYLISDKEYVRKSARVIVIENNKIYLAHSKKDDYYKLPGGGVDKNETKKGAASRECLEESGVRTNADELKFYGVYIDKWKSVRKNEDNIIWVNKSYYYIGKRIGDLENIKPTESEIFAEYESALVDIDVAIKANEKFINSESYNSKYRGLERENYIFKLIKEELV